MPMSAIPRRVILLLSAGLLVAGCQPPSPPPPTVAIAATKPAQAVRQLTAHLRDNELQAFAREAVPPELHGRLEAAWREGRTRWPLDELPFGSRLPEMLAALAAPDAEAHLQQVFERQFAGADRALKTAAASLGLFGAQYVAHEAGYSDDERQHYAQLIAAISQWGASAPLGDRQRARQALAQLAGAARRTGLTSAAAFREAGMDASLRRLGPFAAAFKQALTAYGLDLDADLGTLEASLQQQTGDRARVRMRYRLAGQDIDTVVSLRRVDGRWYLTDYLRHAEAALARPAPAHAVPSGPVTGPGPRARR